MDYQSRLSREKKKKIKPIKIELIIKNKKITMLQEQTANRTANRTDKRTANRTSNRTDKRTDKRTAN